jgi:hypothetical protein
MASFYELIVDGYGRGYFYDTSFRISWHHLLRRHPFTVRGEGWVD